MKLLTIYKQGDFEDLCRGSSLTKYKRMIKFQTNKVAGAYLWWWWKKNEIITKNLWDCIFDKQALFDYTRMLEEAKKETIEN